jgi:ankyrin repeat protein
MNIFEAIEKNSIEKFEELLNTRYSDAMPHVYTNFLDLACKSRHIEIVKLLLEHPDIDVNIKSHEAYDRNGLLYVSENSPLHEVKNIEILNVILDTIEE